MKKRHVIILFTSLVVVFAAATLGFITAILQRAHTAASHPLTASLEHTMQIDDTPLRIQRIREIGQFETLSIEDEELVDTTRERLILPDEHLVRIYRGTLRLGIDLAKAGPNWATCHGDTATLVLPHACLLDDNYIDEAQAQTFYESGSWNAQSRKDMLSRADATMRRRCLTDSNLRRAEQNGKETFTRIFQSLGYTTVQISYRE